MLSQRAPPLRNVRRPSTKDFRSNRSSERAQLVRANPHFATRGRAVRAPSPPQFFPPFRPGYPIAGIQPLASFRVFRGHILGSSLQLRYADVFLHATQFDVLADLIAHR
jgi:hypothetical protein